MPCCSLSIHVSFHFEYLAALKPVLVLGLQLIQGSPETLLLLRRNSGVRLFQKGAS